MRIARNPVLLVALPVLGYLTLLVLVGALWVKPPLLGWIGFGVVGAIGALLGTAGAVLFPRMRVAVPDAPARAAEGPGVLVLVDTSCTGGAFCESIAARVHGRDAIVHVVAPVLPSALHYLTDDERADSEEAERRLEAVLYQLRRRGVEASGGLGDDDPLQAIADALAWFPAGELVIVTPTRSHWLERGLVEHAERLVPRVEHVVVEPEPALV
jgi:hypothetical protein